MSPSLVEGIDFHFRYKPLNNTRYSAILLSAMLERSRFTLFMFKIIHTLRILLSISNSNEWGDDKCIQNFSRETKREERDDRV